jgi:hypothetical protein
MDFLASRRHLRVCTQAYIGHRLQFAVLFAGKGDDASAPVFGDYRPTTLGGRARGQAPEISPALICLGLPRKTRMEYRCHTVRTEVSVEKATAGRTAALF